MLRLRALTVVVPVTVIVVMVCSVVPAAADGPVVIVGDSRGGLQTTVQVPGSPGGSVAGTDKGSASDGGGGALAVTCSYEPDTSNHLGETPPWEVAAPHTGEDGAWFIKACSDGTADVVWIGAGAAAPATVAAPVVTPAQLAAQAVGYLPLPAPRPRHSPDVLSGRPQTVVGLETWFWLDAATYVPLSQTTSATSGAATMSATVTATPVSSTWRSGSADAPDVVCAGPGAAYDLSRSEESQATDCQTIYRRSSARQPQTGPSPNDRFFTASVTTTWRVSWTGTGGAGGTLPDITRTATFPLAVAEIQAVNS